MPSVRRFSAPSPLGASPAGTFPGTARGTVRATARAAPARKPAAAVVGVVLAAGLALAGCEYTYDDGRSYAASAAAEATAAPGPLFTRDPLTRDPVGQDELDGWVARTLPEAPQPAVHLGAGVLAAGEVRSDASPSLEPGTYALTLACRSQRRVNFTVSSDTLTLVDLGLRCGINRENVIYLSAPTALTVMVEARTGANYAFRLRKL